MQKSTYNSIIWPHCNNPLNTKLKYIKCNDITWSLNNNSPNTVIIKVSKTVINCFNGNSTIADSEPIKMQDKTLK